jgi:hypothetical protein
MSNLKNVTTYGLIRELKLRGFVTDMLICIEDVKTNLEGFNESLEDDEKVVMSDEDMLSLIKKLPLDDYAERINEDIYDAIDDYSVTKQKQIK